MNPQKRNKVMLIIMDGLGAAPKGPGNAVSLANPVALTKYWDSYPHTYLEASGEAVGLPQNVYGNSEVGHLNIGGGKVILQNLPKINKAIEKGTFFANSVLLEALSHVERYNSSIHIMGCLSDGAVHAHIDHFFAVLKFLNLRGHQGKVYFHVFTDGRDTPPKSAATYLQQLEEKIQQFGIGKIATLSGRALAMDRNKKWDRIEKVYQMLTVGAGNSFKNWHEALQSSYDKNQFDEYIEPSVIPDEGKRPFIQENDAVLFMNFRSDRAIQLTDAILDKTFSEFPRKEYQNLYFASMVQYRKDFPQKVLMPKEYVTLSLGRILSENNLRQLRISESEKFPHVTYFFNGGVGTKYDGEDRIEVQSPKVPTYDLKPEMSAIEITDILTNRIKLGLYDFILLNFANTDMVGHTGNLEACVKSVQVVDRCIQKLVNHFIYHDGIVILTADHGNVEEVLKVATGEIDTEHSFNPVPFMVISKQPLGTKLKYGKLADIAPTILQLMGLQKPDEMRGMSLFS